MSRTFQEYFRCPQQYVRLESPDGLSGPDGYFRFGPSVIAYGRSRGLMPAHTAQDMLEDSAVHVDTSGDSVRLPFNLDEIIDNLRLEHYTRHCKYGSSEKGFVAWAYYKIRPLLAVAVRRHLQRIYLRDWSEIAFPHWPVDHTVDDIMRRTMQLLLRAQKIESVPFIWFWPDGASSAVAMTHDVETTKGRDFCHTLMQVNESFGIPASFQVVPEERYEVPEQYLESIRRRGFEVNVQDLNHDGHLYNDRQEFSRRAAKINEYARKFKAAGFRSAILYHRQEWFSEFQFSYDMSVPCVGHLEPQRGGCCTVMPYFVGEILEIPVTTTQDYSLFHYLRNFSTDLWEKQASLILKQNGLMNFIVHPDYITTAREMALYKQLLAHLAQLRAEANAWLALPGDIDRWWRQRSKMELVNDGGEWRIEGDGSDRARIALASEKNGELVFTIQNSLASANSTTSSRH